MGEFEEPGGGGGPVLIENPRRGWGLQDGRGCGAWRASAVNWGIWGGGGLNIFFRGRNVHRDVLRCSVTCEMLQHSFICVFLNQQTVSGSTPPQRSPDTINWTLFSCSLRG